MRILAAILFLFFVWCIPTLHAQEITITTGGSDPTNTGGGPSTTSGLSGPVITIIAPSGEVSVQVSTVTVTSVTVSVQTVTAFSTNYGSTTSRRASSTITRVVPPTDTTSTSLAWKLTPPSLAKVVGSTVIGVGFWLLYGS